MSDCYTAICGSDPIVCSNRGTAKLVQILAQILAQTLGRGRRLFRGMRSVLTPFHLVLIPFTRASGYG